MNEQPLLTELKLLEERLYDEKNRQPNHHLDQLIISAAYREIELPHRTVFFKKTGWRKILLPLYVAAGFAFAFIPIMFLWQAPLFNAENRVNLPINITYEQNKVKQEVNKQDDSLFNSPSTERKLPELLEVPPDTERAIADKIVTNFNLAIIRNEQLSLKRSEIYTGIELKKALYPEKEAWVRKIIIFLKEDNIEQARLELIQFKEVNPSYPIEDQIKTLTL